jgi:hypothetical protein
LGGAQARNYFFLNPAGHLGLMAVTFLETLPLIQVILVAFFEVAAAFDVDETGKSTTETFIFGTE